MEEERKIIFTKCTVEDLKRFVRGEILYSELVGVPGDILVSEYYLPQCDQDYQMTLDDLKCSINNMIAMNRTAIDFFDDWLARVLYLVSDVIGLSVMIGYPDAEFMDIFFELDNPEFPKTTAQLCLNLLNEMECDSSDYSACILDEEQIMSCWEEYLKRIDYFEQNKQLPLIQWKVTNRQKIEFVLEYQKEKKLEKLNREKQAFYKRLLEELCDEGNLDAIRIKGYACYGDGHPLYSCDWITSRDCMLKLVENGDDDIQAQAANTLGYIYYYGRCNNGIPEYDQAYKYFSLASFFGYYEATYKVGDMLAGGKGIPKNKTAAYRLYKSVYEDCIIKFQAGDTHQTLADAALRMGNAYKNGDGVYPDLWQAYYYFLQAKVAIDIRMKHSDFFGNKKVLSGIEKGLEETGEALIKAGELDSARRTIEVIPGELLKQFLYDVYGDRIVTLEIIEDGEDVLLVFQRKEKEEYDPTPKIMVTIPEVSFCRRIKKLVLRCPRDTKIDIKEENADLYFNQIKYGDDCLKLVLNNKRKVTIWTNVMEFNLEDQR